MAELQEVTVTAARPKYSKRFGNFYYSPSKKRWFNKNQSGFIPKGNRIFFNNKILQLNSDGSITTLKDDKIDRRSTWEKTYAKKWENQPYTLKNLKTEAQLDYYNKTLPKEKPDWLTQARINTSENKSRYLEGKKKLKQGIKDKDTKYAISRDKRTKLGYETADAIKDTFAGMIGATAAVAAAPTAALYPIIHPGRFIASVASSSAADAALQKAGLDDKSLKGFGKPVRTLLSMFAGGMGDVAANTIKQGLVALETKAANQGTKTLLGSFANKAKDSAIFGERGLLNPTIRGTEGQTPFFVTPENSIKFNAKNIVPNVLLQAPNAAVGTAVSLGAQTVEPDFVKQSTIGNAIWNYTVPLLLGKGAVRKAAYSAERGSHGQDNPINGAQDFVNYMKARFSLLPIKSNGKQLMPWNPRYREAIRQMDNYNNSLKRNKSGETKEALEWKQYLKDNPDMRESLQQVVQIRKYATPYTGTYATNNPEGNANAFGANNLGVSARGSVNGKKLSDIEGFTDQQFKTPTYNEFTSPLGSVYQGRNYGVKSVDDMLRTLSLANGTKNESNMFAITTNAGQENAKNMFKELNSLYVYVNGKLTPLVNNGQIDMNALQNSGISMRSRDFQLGTDATTGKRIVSNVDGHRAYPTFRIGKDGTPQKAYTIQVDVAGGATMGSHGNTGLLAPMIDATHKNTIATVNILKGVPDDLLRNRFSNVSNAVHLYNPDKFTGLIKNWANWKNKKHIENARSILLNAYNQEMNDIQTRLQYHQNLSYIDPITKNRVFLLKQPTIPKKLGKKSKGEILWTPFETYYNTIMQNLMKP